MHTYKKEGEILSNQLYMSWSIFLYLYFFVFCNIFVTGFPAKFGLLSPGRARQWRCCAYPGHWGNRTLLMVDETRVPVGNHRYVTRAKNPFYTVQHILSSAANWDRTHAPHRHWLQACDSDTSVAPWTVQPPRTPFKVYICQKDNTFMYIQYYYDEVLWRPRRYPNRPVYKTWIFVQNWGQRTAPGRQSREPPKTAESGGRQ
jgi:hypothetical protein